MIVNYEAQPLLDVARDEASEHFERMIQDGLPGFVIRAAGENGHDVYREFESQLAAIGFQRTQEGRPIFFGSNLDPEDVRYSDRPLHVDRRSAAHSLASPISMHHTSAGSLKASFFELSEGYFTVHKGGVGHLPVKSQLQFDEGKVDDDLLVANGWEAEVNAGDLVVFRLGGRKPLAHIFQSTELPRYSTALDMEITPTDLPVE